MASTASVTSVVAAFRAKTRQPGWWWAWAALPASLGLLIGLAPVHRSEIACGTPILPTGSWSCEGHLTVRLTASLALLGIAFVMVVVGVMVTSLPLWRSCLCIVGIMVLALCSYVALRALTLEGGGAYCNMYLTRSANDRAQFGPVCNSFWSAQLRRSLWASAGMALAAALIFVSIRVGRRSRGVPPFVPNQTGNLSR